MIEPYGKRLRRASWKEYREFWAGFRLIVTLSGLIATGILQAIKSWTKSPMLSAVEAVKSGAIGLSLSVLGTYLYSRRKGAESLDKERNAQVDKATADAKEKAQQIASLENELRQKDEEIRKKHPHDLMKEHTVQSALNELSEAQRAAFAWLLDAGETSRGALKLRGLDADAFHQKIGFPPLLIFRSFRPGNGMIEIDRYYSINPEWHDALRNFFYGPSDLKRVESESGSLGVDSGHADETVGG